MKHAIRTAVFSVAVWALTSTLSAVPPTPQQIAIEIDRLAKAQPQLAKDPAALAIFAAKASGIYSTDRVVAQNIFNRHIGMSGEIKGGIAYDGVAIGVVGGRTAEMQRFLEMHDLVPAGPGDDGKHAGTNEMIRIGRNRIRFVAAILQQDISKMEQIWATQDVASAVAENTQALRALSAQQSDLAFQIQLLRSQRNDIR